MNNAERAICRIATYLDKLKDESDTRDQPHYPQIVLRDALTDLRHVAETYALDFDQALSGSAEVFAEEIELDKEDCGSFYCESCRSYHHPRNPSCTAKKSE